MRKTEHFSRDDLDNLIKKRGKRVLRRFEKEATSGVDDQKLLEVLQFVTKYWKDNFRPAFASFCCEAVGGQIEAAEDVSLMITLTSAGGGIHDDIIDKSSHKHFRRTVLGKYGLDYALLVGDLLIIKGWGLAKKLIGKFQPEKLEKVIEIFGSWTSDVCEAEFMEISCRQNLDTELEQYQKILCKSMADTQACAKLGALIGGGSKNEIQALATFANRLAFMYRLADDIKDTLNKELNLSYRLQYESVPLPILYSAKASLENKSLIKKIIKISAEDDKCFGKLLNICYHSKAFDFALNIAKETTKEALKNLQEIKPSKSKEVLRFMIQASLAEIRELM